MNYPILHLKHFESHLYPSFSDLWRVAEPPIELFVQGSERALQLLEKLPEQGLAVVGTRNPQARSIQFATQKIQELAGSGLIIVSGLARGIDAAAHSAALKGGLPTIAVIGAGLALDYPRENSGLRKEILAADGLIISEFPNSTPALGHHFLRRNRLIAGWSKATWVVEAAHPSGALSTAKWAREQNRTCLATPCYPKDPSLAGNQTLLDQDHALAFWGIHSLGAVWLELATFSGTRPGATFSSKRPNQRNLSLWEEGLPGPDSDERLLQKEVARLTGLLGGAPVQDLLNWGISQGWNPQRFFVTLQRAIQKNGVFDRNGVLISKQ